MPSRRKARGSPRSNCAHGPTVGYGVFVCAFTQLSRDGLIETKDWYTPLLKASIEAKDYCGNTSLNEASEKGHLEIVKYLIDKKANIEVKN